MMFKALACDYDGTLASRDRIGPEALGALERARDAGLRLVLVTGRTFFELVRVCDRLDLFDAVVAENGAVLYYPAQGMVRDLGQPPPPRLNAELGRRGIPFETGRVIVGVARGSEEKVREAMAATGVRLETCYNRERLMLLPAGISKGSGVRRAIHELGLSFHDVLALGDAENDLELFRACGGGACPENAVAELKAEADWVFPGEDGPAIASAITGPILSGSLPLPTSPRQRIRLGWALRSSEPVTIPARMMNLLIAGEPLSGKSQLAGMFVEGLLRAQYAVCVIDPEGDYHTLARVPGVTWMEIRYVASVEIGIGQFYRNPSACVVLDLARLSHAGKVAATEKGLALVRRLRRERGVPHWVVLDEAHYSLHHEGIAEQSAGIEDRGFCLVTYKPSWLRESAIKATDLVLLTRAAGPGELSFLSGIHGTSGVRNWRGPVSLEFPRDVFLLIQPDETGSLVASTVRAFPRETPHMRHISKYAHSPVPPDRCFFFRDPDGQVVAVAASLKDLRRAVGWVEDRVLAFHAAREDFSRWVLDVFRDRDLGGMLKKYERRWIRGELSDLRRAIEGLISVGDR